jgi:hypothetical protein
LGAGTHALKAPLSNNVQHGQTHGRRRNDRGDGPAVEEELARRVVVLREADVAAHCSPEGRLARASLVGAQRLRHNDVEQPDQIADFKWTKPEEVRPVSRALGCSQD